MMDRPDPMDPIAFPDGPPPPDGGDTIVADPEPAKDPPTPKRLRRREPAELIAKDIPPAPLGRWSFAQIGAELLDPNPWQPRQTFNDAEMTDLMESVRAKGVLQPILVRPAPGTGPTTDKPLRYQIAAGERRWRAAVSAGLPTVPAYIRDLSDEEMQSIAVIENAERADLPLLEEADAVRALLQRRQPNGEPYTPEMVAAELGRGLTWTYQRLKLTELIPPFREALNEGRILLAHALIAARLAPSAQALLAEEVLTATRWDGRANRKVPVSAEEMSTPAAWDKIVKARILLDLERAPFSKVDPSLNPAQGACETCDLRTGNLPSLFGDVKPGICTAPSCFAIKLDVHLRRSIEEMQKDGKGGVALYDGYNYGQRLPKESLAVQLKAVTREGWEDATKKKCEYSTWGLVVAGEHHSTRLGERIRVCLESSCKIHHPYDNGGSKRSVTADRKQSEAQKARRRQELFDQEVKRRVRWRVGLQAAEGIVKRGPRAVLTHLLHFAWDETQHDAQVAMLRELGIDVPKQEKSNTADPEVAFRKYLDNPKPISRDTMAVLLTLAEQIKFSYYQPGEADRVGFREKQPAFFGNVVKALKIDVKSIEKAIRAELTAEREAKGKRKPSPAAANGKGGKAGTPTTKARKR